MTQTILITGANRGIGLEMVRQFADTDSQVLATCRAPDETRDLQQLASWHPERITVYPLDITSSVSIAALKESIGDLPLDILINNAGSYGPTKPFGQTDPEAWMNTLRTNCIGPLQMMEIFASNVAAGSGKLMVNLSSKMGSMTDNSSGGVYIYRSSKAALNAVVVSAAHDLLQQGIIVVAMHPGWVLTDMGGPGAEMTVTESVMAMRRLMDDFKLSDSGRFIDINGADIPW